MNMSTRTAMIIADLRCRVQARENGETTGYGDGRSLVIQIQCRAEPELKELTMLSEAGVLEAHELLELEELTKLTDQARRLCANG
jgi:hypothetical protein